MAAGHSVDTARRQAMFDQAMARRAGRFRRVEPRATARAFVHGLLSGVERKNCRQLAGEAAMPAPARCRGCCEAHAGTPTGCVTRSARHALQTTGHTAVAPSGLVNLAQAPPGTGRTRPLPTTAHQPLGHLDREATVEY